MSSIFSGLTAAEIAALPLDVLASASLSDLSSLAPAQMSALTASELGALGSKLGAFPIAEIQALNTGALASAAAAVIAALRPAQVAALTRIEVAALGAPQLMALDKAQLAALTPDEIAALSPGAIVGLGAGKVGALSGRQVAALTALEIIGMTRKERAALSGANVGSLSTAVINSLSPAALQQLGGLTPAQVAGFSAATLPKLSLAQFNLWIAPDVAGLSATKFARLTPAELQALDASEIAQLTGAEIAALTATQILALAPSFFAAASPAALANLSSAQLAMMTTAQIAAVHASANPILQDAVAHESAGALGYSGALAVLQDVARTGMNATAFSELTALAHSLGAAGGIAAPVYVQQLFDDVVLGSSSNAHWNGGGNVALALGDLAANASTAQFDELIGKWFLGTDLPGTELDPNGQSYGSSYETYTLPLFASGAPVMTDVAQGQLGDCWFLAAVAETAQQDPSLIENMITANGDGTYTIEFQSQSATPKFITVNDALPTYSGGESQMDGSRMVFANSKNDLWAPLIEKALAQLSGESEVTTGMDYYGLGNQYLSLTAGDGEGITFLTGQAVLDDDLYGLSTSAQAALLGRLQASLAAGQDVLLGTSDLPAAGNLVDDHMFAVTSIDAATGMVGLYNPWGANAPGNGYAETFTISVSALAADEATFFQATGSRPTA